MAGFSTTFFPTVNLQVSPLSSQGCKADLCCWGLICFCLGSTGAVLARWLLLCARAAHFITVLGVVSSIISPRGMQSFPAASACWSSSNQPPHSSSCSSQQTSPAHLGGHRDPAGAPAAWGLQELGRAFPSFLHKAEQQVQQRDTQHI